MTASKAGMRAWVAGTMRPHMPSRAAAAMERKMVDLPAQWMVGD
jgi:hypothetical protein